MTTADVPHRIEFEVEVRGTPEQVWQAIATADGISSWMMPTELDAKPGGAVTFHMGPGAESRGRVTAFEPTRRVEYEEDWATLMGQPGADVTPLVTEFVVEARSGGTCVVRVVTSAFGTGADWENDFWEEMEAGWAPMLDNLRLYLALFPGQRATAMFVGATFPAAPEDAIAAVRHDLGAKDVGDAVAIHGVDGLLERTVGRHFLVRLSGSVPGFLSFSAHDTADGCGVHLQGHLFSDAAPAYVERQQRTWQAWLDGIATSVGAARPAGRTCS